MKRTDIGDIVRFFVGQGDDAAIFEFSIPVNTTRDGRPKYFDESAERVPPPMYSELRASNHTRLRWIIAGRAALSPTQCSGPGSV